MSFLATLYLCPASWSSLLQLNICILITLYFNGYIDSSKIYLDLILLAIPPAPSLYDKVHHAIPQAGCSVCVSPSHYTDLTQMAQVHLFCKGEGLAVIP